MDGNGQPENLTKKVELVNIDDLKSHPRNYRDHPDDQLEHIAQSIKDNGFYRNVVVSRDGTILAGHGVVKAATKIGLKQIPVIRLDLDSNDGGALKILIGDNEMARLAIADDRALTEMLKEIKDWDANALLGTGFDESMLAAFLFVTRPADEIADKDAAAHWAGMPEYDEGANSLKVIVHFRNQADRLAFARLLNIEFSSPERQAIPIWWPLRERQDLSSLKFEG